MEVRAESGAPNGADSSAGAGPKKVLLSAGASPLSGPFTLDQARRYVLADYHARFRRMRGDSVLFSFGFDSFASAKIEGPEGEAPVEDSSKRRSQLESLDLSVDWSRSFESAEAASERWAQQVFHTLAEAGQIQRGETAMRWCATCRTALPDDGTAGEGCRRCDGPARQLPAGDWYLKLDINAKTAGAPPEGPFDSSVIAATAPEDLLGRVEGAELEVKTMVGTPLTLFTPFPQRMEEARFIALSPGHPALETLILDADLKKRVSDLEQGHSEKRGLDYPTVMDTGVWIPVPDVADPLPLIVSLAVDARFGVTAVLGIPSADPVDGQLAELLPAAPALRWDARAKGSKPRPAVRFRAHLLPISSSDGRGVPIPPEAPDGALDPRTGAWAEALVAIPPGEREDAGLDNAELCRWLPSLRTVESNDCSAAVLCDLALLDALPETASAEGASNGNGRAGSLIVGWFDTDPAADGSPDPSALAEQFGAGTLRFALLYAAAPAKSFRSTEFDAVLRSSARFLEKLDSYAEAHHSPAGEASTVAIDPSDRLRRRLSKWCEMALRRVTENNEELASHRATRNIEMLLDRIEDFERRAREERGELTAEDTDASRAALRLLTLLLTPIAPEACERLWGRTGSPGSAAGTPWPKRTFDH